MNYPEEYHRKMRKRIKTMVETTSAAQMAEYLSKNYVVSEEDAGKLCTQPEAATIIESAVSCRSYLYYPADKIADAYGLVEVEPPLCGD